MRSNITKAIIAIILFIILISTIIYINTGGSANNDGYITVIINNKNNQIVSQERIAFEKGDTLFDVIDENYELTCDNSAYGHYILGISGKGFMIMTEGNTSSWIWFEVAYLKDGIEYSNNINLDDYNQIEVNNGIDNIELKNNMIFAINERDNNHASSVFNQDISFDDNNYDIIKIILIIISIILISLICIWLIIKINHKKTKITIKQLAILAFMTSILFIQEQLLSFIPNVQFTFMLIALYTSVFGLGKVSIIIFAHVLLDNLFMSSINPIVMLPMLIGYLIFAILVNLVKNKSLIFIILFASIGSVIYCLCFLVANALFLDISIWAYFIADIPFEIILVISTIITIMYAYRPLEKILKPRWDDCNKL